MEVRDGAVNVVVGLEIMEPLLLSTVLGGAVTVEGRILGADGLVCVVDGEEKAVEALVAGDGSVLVGKTADGGGCGRSGACIPTAGVVVVIGFVGLVVGKRRFQNGEDMDVVAGDVVVLVLVEAPVTAALQNAGSEGGGNVGRTSCCRVAMGAATPEELPSSADAVLLPGSAVRMASSRVVLPVVGFAGGGNSNPNKDCMAASVSGCIVDKAEDEEEEGGSCTGAVLTAAVPAGC